MVRLEAICDIVATYAAVDLGSPSFVVSRLVAQTAEFRNGHPRTCASTRCINPAGTPLPS